MDYTKHLVSTQLEQDKPSQKQNNAGGYSFVLDDWARLQRFLILGSEGGTYYVGERALTRDNAKVVERLLAIDGPRVVNEAVEVSLAGRAPKNDAAIFVLALASASKDPATRAAAFENVHMVCRIGTHIMQYTAMVDSLRGWGTGLRRTVANWYNRQSPAALVKQVTKYQQRGKWSNKDLLRLSHAIPVSLEHASIYRWMVGAGVDERTVKGKGVKGDRKYPAVAPVPYLMAFEELRACRDTKRAVELITQWGFTHEMTPNELKDRPDVWEALARDMPITATIRNLNKLTQVGLLKPFSETQKLVVERITDLNLLKKGRVHPLSVLLAMTTYAAGKGVKGSLTWTPEQKVVNALNDAFYSAFHVVEPTGKNHLLALDVSGSMSAAIMNTHLTCREASAAMALVTARIEPNTHIVGFTSGRSSSGGMWNMSSAEITPLNVSPTMRLEQVVKNIGKLDFGGTDCSLPMLYAMKNKLEVDAFVVYTDNETWAGAIHPHIALEQYRQQSGRAAKLVVVGMTATEFTIADPDDAGMVDIVGFDGGAPAVMADFVRG